MFGKGLSKKIMPALFMFAKMHLNPPHPTKKNNKKTRDFWNNVLWTDKAKVEMFSHWTAP